MSDKKRDLEMNALKKFRLIYGAVKTHFKDIEKLCGVSSSQLWILKIIRNYPGIGVTDVAKKLAIHQTTASILVEKLAKKNLIKKTRSPEDQRRIVLFINVEGMEILSKAPDTVEGLLPHALSNLSESSLNQLDHDLELIIEQFDSKFFRLADVPLAEL